MNNSLKIVKELDPDGILDKDVNNDNFKRDGEAVDPCHTLSSSEGESEDEATPDGKEKEMEVDQPDAPILTSTTVSPAAGSEPRKLPDPAPTAGSATTGSATIVPDASPAVFQSGSGSGSGTGTDEQVKEPVPGASNSLYNVDPNSKLGKAILQSKFKIPDIPKSSSSEKVPTGVKDPGPKKIVNPIPAEADAVPSKTYTKIISSKLLKGKVGTIGGITSGQGVSESVVFLTRETIGY